VQLLGAPQRLVAAASERRRVAHSPGVDIVADAVVPLCRHQAVETYDPTDHQPFAGWKAGVYDKNRQVCEASLLDRHWTRVTVPFWAREIDLDHVRWHRGEAMYGGLLFHHFGRFLLETTNRLWWCLAQEFRGPIIFQNTGPRRGVPDFAQRYFALLGLADRIIIAEQPLGFDRIVVPHRSYIGQRRFHDEFHAPFLAAAAAAERLPLAEDDAFAAGMAGLYLSRTRFTNRSSVGEPLVEKKFSDAGFYIAHTQELPLQAQILLVRRHTKIAGIAGSAFHNILFSEGGMQPIYICKDYDINANYFMIDELMKNDGIYIYAGSAAEAEMPKPARELLCDHWGDVALDTAKVLRCLEDAGDCLVQR
jgi:capsular polysaccharide biosynthesis protein